MSSFDSSRDLPIIREHGKAELTLNATITDTEGDAVAGGISQLRSPSGASGALPIAWQPWPAPPLGTRLHAAYAQIKSLGAWTQGLRDDMHRVDRT